MNLNYTKYLEHLTDESSKEVLTLTFGQVVPEILGSYENEKIQANVLISFSELIQIVSVHGFSKQLVDANPFYQVYTDFCDSLFAWTERLDEKCTVYDIFERTTSYIILDCIIRGFKKGTISSEDFEVPTN